MVEIIEPVEPVEPVEGQNVILDIKSFDDTTIIGVSFNSTTGVYAVFWFNRFILESYNEIGTFTDGPVDNIKLLIQENTVYISPFNKQINFIDGQWYLNDTISTTPIFTTSLTSPEPSTGTITVNGDLAPTGQAATGLIQFIDITVESTLVTISIGGDIDVSFTGLSSDTTEELAEKAESALLNDSTFNERYNLSRSADSIFIEAFDIGSFYNANVNIMPSQLTNVSDITGGEDSQIPQGSISITIDGITVNAVGIVTGDDRFVIAEKIYNAINASQAIKTNFSIDLSDNVVELERTTVSGFNTEIIVSGETVPIDVVNFTEFSIIGSLTPEEDYWYTVRYVYRDGHRTKTAFPKKVRISNLARSVTLTVQGDQDLKHSDWADIEVFRRLGSGTFFLIGRVDGDENVEFVDEGRTNIRPLDEQNYIWNDTHQTHEIVRDRYVRANIDYKDNDYDGDASVSITAKPTWTEIGTPINTNFELYARPRFQDGTESFFKLKDTLEVDESGNLRIVYGPYTGDQDIKEVGYYGTYSPNKNIDGDKISFASNELYNQHIPSIATHTEDEALQDRPLSPHLFVGFKYFNRRIEAKRIEILDSEFGDLTTVTYEVRDRVYDKEWGNDDNALAITNIEDGEYVVVEGGTNDFDSVITTDIYPRYIEKEIIPGIKLLYKYKYDSFNYIFRSTEPPITNSVVYELAWVSGLNEYASNANLRVSLDAIVANRASTTRANSDIKASFVDVLGLQDTSLQATHPVRFLDLTPLVVGEFSMIPTDSSRVYLVCNSDSIYSDIDLEAITDYGVYDDWQTNQFSPPNKSLFDRFIKRYESSMFNIEYQRDDVSDNFVTRQITVGGDVFSYRERLYNDKVVQTVPDIAIEDGTAIYLGSIQNGTGVFNTNHTGFTINESDDFRYWTLDPSNIYATIIEENDLESLQSKFPNQLIWSQPFLLGTNISGARTFEFNAVLDIAQDYGPIIDVRYVRNDLVVFCERGVARVNVGEVLTQQPSGSTFVDTSRFLTGFFWILKNVPRIEVNSIAEFEHNLFFSDGLDIWMLSSDGLKNVSLGSIDLNEGAELFGCIDPENKEYRLYDGQNTWAHNFEVDEFMGPYTYNFTASTNVRDKLYNVVDYVKVVEQNVGNTFDGEEYETVIESVSNDLNEPSIEKLFRKFLVDMEQGGQFTYGKEYDEFVPAPVVRDRLYQNIGVKPSEANSPRMFWRVTSTAEDFVLKMVSFIYSLRRRR